MAKLKRVAFKAPPSQSRVRLNPRGPDQTRFDTVASLNIKLVPREALLAWRPKVFALIVLLLLGGGLYEFFADEIFFVEQVDTAGLNILAPREIERASGAMGYNIFFLEPSQVERAVLRLPEVKSANVLVGIPSALLVQIEERTPEIVWFRGTEAYWVDGDGIAFKARSPRADLPTVRDLDTTELQAGRRVTPAAFNALHALYSAWPQAPKNLEWAPANGLSAIDEHGWKIIFGDASDMELKVTKLKALIPRLLAQGTRVKFIDLGKGELFYQ